MQTFDKVYYSVDLPADMEEPKGQRPEDAGRLSILNVRLLRLSIIVHTKSGCRNTNWLFEA